MNWHFDWDSNKKKLSVKEKILKTIEQLTGVRLFEYKNYTLK
jgi:hypothetical protein